MHARFVTKNSHSRLGNRSSTQCHYTPMRFSRRPVQSQRHFFWRKKEQEPPPPPPSTTPPRKLEPLKKTYLEENPIQKDVMRQRYSRPQIPGVKNMIAVASGKGGVGKSTVAVNLALALMKQNKRVGLLDADIYGPSIPTMLNIRGPPQVNKENRIIPHQNYGIKAISIGFMIQEDAPTIWRGPMVMNALDQLLHNVDWGELDVLVTDLPPGTGDAQLTLTQKAPLDGAIIVSTPQDIALIDARRGLNMFRTVNVPVFGIIENMSYFECSCGERCDIFGTGGAKNTAEKMGADFLGEIPIVKDVRVLSDTGKPIVVSMPDSPVAKKFDEIAIKVIEKLNNLAEVPRRRMPKILME